jgi:hypothetical protein
LTAVAWTVSLCPSQLSSPQPSEKAKPSSSLQEPSHTLPVSSPINTKGKGFIEKNTTAQENTQNSYASKPESQFQCTPKLVISSMDFEIELHNIITAMSFHHIA